MNRLIYKSIALLLSVVMFFSGAMMYAPSYAITYEIADDYEMMPEDSDWTELNVKGNDTWPAGAQIYMIAWNPDYGQFDFASGYQDVKFKPKANVNTETYVRCGTYYVKDTAGDPIGSAKVYIHITPVNDPITIPSEDPMELTTNMNEVIFFNPLDGASDIDGEPRILEVIDVGPADGVGIRINDNLVQYTPNAGFVGLDEIKVRIWDGVYPGDYIDKLVRISVVDIDSNVLANDDFDVMYDTDGFVLIDVLQNDIPGDLTGTEITHTTTPHNGGVSINGDFIEYTPDASFIGIDSFEYTVERGGDDWTAIVLVDVRADMSPVLLNRDFTLFTGIGEAGSVDVSLNEPNEPYDSFPSYFDVDSLVVTAQVPVLQVPSNGAVSSSGSVVSYFANTMEQVMIEYEVEDKYGHKGFGEINVIVTEDASYAQVIMGDLPPEEIPLRVDQYSSEESIRPYVTYHPGIYEDVMFKYEKVTFDPDLYPEGYYDPTVKDADGNPISIVYYYGEFLVEYWMRDTGNNTASDGFRKVSVNAQPLISLLPDIDPEAVRLPGDAIHTVVPSAITDYDDDELYAGFDMDYIYSMLYGFDFEDYPHDVTENIFDSPTDLQVKFYLADGIGRNLDEFWTYVVVGNTDDFVVDPEGSRISGEDLDGMGLDGDFTIYDIQFTLTDNEEYESEKTEPWALKVYNEDPVLYKDIPVDDYLVLGPENDFELMYDWMVEDDEDENYADPIYGYTGLPLIKTLDDMEIIIEKYNVDTPPEMIDPVNFDSSDPGGYRIQYRYYDLHGEYSEWTIHLLVVPESEIYLEMSDVEMETGGYFPTFMGVTADFWEPPGELIPTQLNPSGPQLENGMRRESVEAWIGEDLIGKIYVRTEFMMIPNFGEVHQFMENNVNLDIDYYLVQEFYDDDHWEPFVTGPMTRDMFVTNEYFGDYFMTSDIGMVGGSVQDAQLVAHDFNGIQFPVVAKYKFIGDEPDQELHGRIFTTIFEDMTILPPPSIAGDEISTEGWFDDRRYFEFLDLAETVNGQVYGIGMDQRLWKFDELTAAFVECADLHEMMMHPNMTDAILGRVGISDARLEMMPILSLTADGEGNIVFMVTGRYMPFYDTILEIHHRPDPTFNLIVVMDPDGNIISVDVADAYDGYPIVNDIAYDEEFQTLYAVVMDDFDFGMGSLSIANVELESMYGPFHQELVKYEMMDTSQLETTIYVYLNRYVKTSLDTLMFGDHFTGIAVVNDELLLTKLILDTLWQENQFETKVDVVDLDGVLIYPDFEIPGLFTWGFGAAASIYKIVDAEPESEELFINYNPDGYVNPTTFDFDAIMSPLHAFTDETINWSIIEGYEYASIDQNGVVDVHEEEILRTETLTIRAEADNIYDDVELIVTMVYNKVVDATPEPVSLHLGYNYGESASVDLDATMTPEIGFDDDEITWSVISGVSYVSVDDNGLVTVINASEIVNTVSATVRAEADGAYDDVTVTITRHTMPPVTPSETTYTTSTPTIRVRLDTDAITLDYGASADPEFTSYDFTETVTGTSNKDVTWSLSDDEYVTVDEEGVVTAKEDIPVETGDFTVTLTVRTVVGGKTDTATILFEEQTPLGAIEFFEPYIVGYPSGAFMPANDVTRAEVATMFAKILDLNTEFPGSQKYTDVSPDAWYFTYVQAVSRANLFEGHVTDEFRPNEAITRAEMSSVFAKYWEYLDISVNGDKTADISDVTATHWASAAIFKMYNADVVDGFPDGTFKPDNHALREQVVIMINRLIGRPGYKAEKSKFSDVGKYHWAFENIEAASQTFLKPQGD